MITAARIRHIMGLTSVQVNYVLRRSGYQGEIRDAEFLGLSNSGEFCFGFTYFDQQYGQDKKAKLWIKEDSAGQLIADF